MIFELNIKYSGHTQWNLIYNAYYVYFTYIYNMYIYSYIYMFIYLYYIILILIELLLFIIIIFYTIHIGRNLKLCFILNLLTRTRFLNSPLE